MAFSLIIGLIITFVTSLEAQTDVLFEYGPKFSDKTVELSSSGVQVDIPFDFYGQKYSNVWIARDGHISFGEKPAVVMKKNLPYIDGVNSDPPMAAVYFAALSHTNINEAEEQRSKVYYRTEERTDENYPDILKELGYQVRINSVSDMARFWPKRAIIATWHNVRYQECTEPACLRNTFQAAIMTDDVYTYAIYNYGDLTWRGGMLQDCIDGVGPTCFSAQVGFNAGRGKQFTPLPFSGTDQVMNLNQHHGSKVKGRYIYQISTRRIFRDACTTADKIPTLYPRSVSMMGGDEILIAGPCLPDSTKTVECQIENGALVQATVLDTGRLSCVTPLYYGLGEVKFTVKYDNQQYTDDIHISPPKKHVKLNEHDKWLERDPDQLRLSWSPLMLNKIYVDPDQGRNVTIDPPKDDEVLVDNVIVALFGYTEGNGEPNWKFLKILDNNHPNSGDFSFKPADHVCTDDCSWHVGAIKIIPSDGTPEKSRGLFSDLFPMGWYIESVMVESHGTDWPDKLCDEWQDEGDVNWEEELIECPCSRDQAYADAGRFIVDADCDGSGPCPFHKDASICYISRTPTAKGGQTRCCYKVISDEMIPEPLIYSAAVQTGGSYSSAAHENGLYPYTLSRKDYPVFSHWTMDKLPMIWCCVWSFDKDLCMVKYEPKRRTPGCHSGNSSQTAFAFGDPHFLTFDGTYYTFNGYAEYWLLRVQDLELPDHNFRLQARLENYIGAIRDLNATVITAVAMQQGLSLIKDLSPKVTLFLNPPLALDRISVFVNDEFEEFFTTDSRRFFDNTPDRPLYINRHSDNMICNNFTVTFSNGVSVNVAEAAGMLQVITTVPPMFFKHTGGLFGYWDGNKDNDLRTKDGTVEVDPNNNREVHEKFGADWAVEEAESVFTYFPSYLWSHYQKMSFVPVYEPAIPPGSNLTKAKVDETCQEDKFCRFDYMTTQNEQVALASLQVQTRANQVRLMSQEVVACPYLNIEGSKRSADSNNLAGGEVKLTSCVEGYTLVGPSDYDCVVIDEHDASWTPNPSATICKSDREIAAEKQEMAVAIAVPLTIVFLVLLISIAAFMIFKRRKTKETTDKGRLPPEDLPRQQAPVNPNPVASLYTYPEANLNLSRTSISSKVSRGSNNELVLEQQVHPQRPQRPPKQAPVPMDQDQSQYYQNAPGEQVNEGYQQNGHDAEMQPREGPVFHQPPPPSCEAYENQATDVNPDEEVTHERAPSRASDTFV